MQKIIIAVLVASLALTACTSSQPNEQTVTGGEPMAVVKDLQIEDITVGTGDDLVETELTPFQSCWG